ncbi:hypothetical protein ATANTOWER_000059 [Ataeniobius toweri]|uniref:Uncharacterized protein n=1 Tax=Ataeniobius toweri TaxID=208326 RepID=A0ABU7BYV3_9TELE|nr:hypothetical protein [Ataeniobius toweri]
MLECRCDVFFLGNAVSLTADVTILFCSISQQNVFLKVLGIIKVFFVGKLETGLYVLLGQLPLTDFFYDCPEFRSTHLANSDPPPKSRHSHSMMLPPPSFMLGMG